MNEVTYYYGIYFSITKTVTKERTVYKCTNDPTHFSPSNGKFCSQCGSEIGAVVEVSDPTYLSVMDIENETGIDEEILLGVGECSPEHQKYFGLNVRLEGVTSIAINRDSFDTAFFETQCPQTVLTNAMENSNYRHIVNRLTEVYGDDFNIHVGIFTTIM